MRQKHHKNLSIKGKITPFFFRNVICDIMCDKHFSNTPSPIFFKIFCCFRFDYRSLTNSVYSENR